MIRITFIPKILPGGHKYQGCFKSLTNWQKYIRWIGGGSEHETTLLIRSFTVIMFLIIFFLNASSADIGAEWNPTGNPIGGGPGYSDSIRHQDADYYVSTKNELLNALNNATAGDIVYIADFAEINLTGTDRIFIPSHTTLASGRGRVLGDTISWGGLIYTDDVTDNSLEFLMMEGKGVRITGLRIRGPYWYREGHVPVNAIDPANNAFGIQAWRDSFEVDNCELWGWSHSCVYIATSQGFYVHHNYMRDCQNFGQGMGCCAGGFGNGIYEANLFDFVRHDIASGGDTTQTWEARWNVCLEHSANHSLDRHGWPTEGAWAGKKTLIHHNTDLSTDNNGVRIRGKPAQACSVYHNWFYQTDSASAVIFWNDTNCYMFDNHFTDAPLAGVIPRLPIAVAHAYPDSGAAPLPVVFKATGSHDPDGYVVWYEWDFGDNSNTIRHDSARYTYNDIGTYMAELTVHDNDGICGSDTVRIIVPPPNDSAYLSVWVNDRIHCATSSDTGYFFKQILIDDNLIWEDDIAGYEGWTHVVKNVEQYVNGQDSVTITIRLYCKKDYPAHTWPECETFWDDIALFWGDVRNGNFESTSDWNYYETQPYFQGNYRSEDVRSGNKGYKLFFWSAQPATAGDYGKISQKVTVTTIGVNKPPANESGRACSLFCPYPNPSMRGATIDYYLSAKTKVSMVIYDISGRLVKILGSEEEEVGYHRVIWDGSDETGKDVANGIYFCKFSTDDFDATRKLVLVR